MKVYVIEGINQEVQMLIGVFSSLEKAKEIITELEINYYNHGWEYYIYDFILDVIEKEDEE